MAHDRRMFLDEIVSSLEFKTGGGTIQDAYTAGLAVRFFEPWQFNRCRFYWNNMLRAEALGQLIPNWSTRK